MGNGLNIIQLNMNDGDRESPWCHDRVTYHLWYYVFLRTLDPLNSSEVNNLKSLHLMIKIMAQMKNESVGLCDQWVLLELIQTMLRMSWGEHVLKLVEVMKELQYNMD